MSISSAPLPDPSSPPATTAAAPAPIPRPTGSDGATATVLPLRPRTTASPVVTVPVALALMALLLALKPALQGSYVGVILFSRGWVQYAIVGCTFWSLGILASKALCHLSAQRPAFRLSCLPHRIEQDLDMATAREICRRMGERFAAASFVGRWALQRSLLFARVYRVLEAVAAGRSLQDASGQQQRLADTDADAVESSFASVRVFVWAIPILGFIGTVLGIGEAVGGFSQAVASAEDLEVIKKSLSGVTTGLAVAFDTTLLALVMSIVVMLPMSALQRLEEGLLGAVDDYTGEHVLSRVRAEPPPAAPLVSLTDATIEAAIARSLAAHEAEARRRTEDLGLACDRAVDRVIAGWDGVYRSVGEALTLHARETTAAVAGVRQSVTETHDALTSLQSRQERATREVTEALTRGVQSVHEAALRNHEQAMTELRAVVREAGAAIGATRQAAGELQELQASLRASQERSVHEMTEALIRGAQVVQEATTRGHEQAVARLQALVDEAGAATGNTAAAGRAAIEEVSRVGRTVSTTLGDAARRLTEQAARLEEALARSTSENLASITQTQATLLAGSRDQVASVVQAAKDLIVALDAAGSRLGAQVKAAAELSASLQQFQGEQYAAALSLEKAASAGVMQRTLGGVEGALNQLVPLMTRLAEPAGEPSRAPRRGGFRWFGRG